MPRQIHLHPHLSVAELERRYRRAHDPNERTWWQILWLLSQGHPGVAVARVTGYSAYWIGQVAKRYNSQGPAGMQNRRHSTSYRPPPVLCPGLQEELRQLLAQAAQRNEHWTGQDVAAWMAERLGRPVTYQLGWSYLVRLKHSLQRPRPRHTLADAAQQDAFKKQTKQKKHKGVAASSRHRLPPRPGRAVGHRRTSHWLEAAAAARLGADRPAPDCLGPPPVRMALLGRLRPSRLGPDLLPSGHYGQHPRL